MSKNSAKENDRASGTPCLWQRCGEPWPWNSKNYWRTGCGVTERHIKAVGTCPYCGREIQAARLEAEK